MLNQRDDSTNRVESSIQSVAPGHGISIPHLRGVLSGPVIAPGDDEYDTARTVFVGGIDRRPAIIVRAADAADVSLIVGLARETGLELAIRSGGHSAAGHSVSDGGSCSTSRRCAGCGSILTSARPGPKQA